MNDRRHVMIELTSHSSSETESLAERLGRSLQGGECIALDGPLGAGKTCFVRGLARGLGLDPGKISSPTFIICQPYAPEGNRDGLTLIHVDAYRLSSGDELETIGWEEMLARPDAVFAVEWAERVESSLTEPRISISFQHVSVTERRLLIDVPVALANRVTAMISQPASHDVRCPTCGNITRAESPTFPFCSSRCRLADLGQWFRESFRLGRPITAEDEDV